MNPIALQVFFQSLMINLPTAIVCLGACIVILGRRKSGSPGRGWALAGFGLGLVIAIGSTITQALAQSWVLENAGSGSPGFIFSMLAGFWSVLHAVVYALIFVAVIAERPEPNHA